MQKKVRKVFFKNVFIHGYIYMRIVNTDFWSINLDPLFLFQGITGILLDKIWTWTPHNMCFFPSLSNFLYREACLTTTTNFQSKWKIQLTINDMHLFLWLHWNYCKLLLNRNHILRYGIQNWLCYFLSNILLMTSHIYGP